MTYEEIVKLAGYEFHKCDPNVWGGTWGYSKKGELWVCNGLKSEKALVSHIIKQHFGDDELGKLCLKLLKKHKPNK
jgi:hypothetical protein